MSDTPKTDKAEGCRGWDDRWITIRNGGDTTADFARGLERENNKLREAQELLRDVVKNSSIQMCRPDLCERIEDYLDESEKNNSPTK
jgi:hypothetical protein